METENKAQTKSIDGIHTTMADHIKSSEPFRTQCTKNSDDLKWFKRIGKWALGGSGVVTLIIASIKLYLWGKT